MHLSTSFLLVASIALATATTSRASLFCPGGSCGFDESTGRYRGQGDLVKRDVLLRRGPNNGASTVSGDASTSINKAPGSIFAKRGFGSIANPICPGGSCDFDESTGQYPTQSKDALVKRNVLLRRRPGASRWSPDIPPSTSTSQQNGIF